MGLINPKAEYTREVYDLTEIKSEKTPVVCLLGPLGSGKRSQAEYFAKYHNWTIIDVSELIKNELSHQNSTRSGLLEHEGDKKKPSHDFVVLDMIKEKISKNGKALGFVIVEFPKTTRQAKLFQKEVVSISAVYILLANKSILMARLNIEERSEMEKKLELSMKQYGGGKYMPKKCIEFWDKRAK